MLNTFLIFCVVYFGFIAVFMRTSNFISALIFKIVPLALCLIASALVLPELF